MRRPTGVRRAAALGLLMGCARVLGIPSDPVLDEDTVPPIDQPAPRSIGTPPDPLSATSAPDETPAVESEGGQDVPLGASNEETRGAAEARRPDAGLATIPPPVPSVIDAGGPEPSPTDCGVGLVRQPVDVVLIVDNSGSMTEATTEIERSLPAFAARLEQGALDYRIILISRHRRDERAASSEASTSLCVALPLGGVARCPSPEPALGPRFFQYSIKIDASDSFERVLEAASAPDPFGLTQVGWIEWLRSGAETVFIEVTDADSALSIDAFASGLAGALPDRFGADSSRPGFMFHSIVGLTEKSTVPGVYAPDEPVEAGVCAGVGTNPDNAGEIYQALSRSTAGLRQPICPADALGARLDVLADDVLGRSACAAVSPED